jgi:Transposase domain (DUF772)/Transposase DDE domain
MTLGVADPQGNMLDDMSAFCEQTLAPDSIYAFLHRERERLFPDSAFADLFSDEGRRSVPPSVVASAMVLQRLEGLSDREAAERFAFDARWRDAAGVGSYDTGGWTTFSHTVFVDMRERLRGSKRPDRVFEIALDAAKAAGLVGKKRVLDSTPLYDSVATMDTITLIRSAIRNLLRVADDVVAKELRAALSSGEEYASAAKPQIDWDDEAAQAELVDSRARDGYAALALLEGRELQAGVAEAVALLATVLGQDLETADNGTFSIARRVAPDRVISTVDPETRHGRKTVAHGSDGWKGHAAIDPDTEIITATAVSPGNAGDASIAEELIADLLEDDEPAELSDDDQEMAKPRSVYGDAAYGTGELQSLLFDAGIDSKLKTQPPASRKGLFAKDRFVVDLERDVVTCPAEVTVAIRRQKDGTGIAKFAKSCAACPLREMCTSRRPGDTSSSGSMKPPWRASARTRPTRAGEPTIERRDRRSSASSATSCDAGTAGDAPACAGTSASEPTSAFSPLRPTLRVSRRSGLARPLTERGSWPDDPVREGTCSRERRRESG